MNFSYANPGSGPSAGGIGWFNFESLSFNPGDSVNGLTGTLKDGTTVTFDMSMELVSGVSRTFVAASVPTYAGAQFGTSNYTGITGNVAMYGNGTEEPGTYAFRINRISVKDINGNNIPNYTVIIADAEVTNLDEYWVWKTNGRPWDLFATLGSGLPELTGTGTSTANITGVASGTQAAYLLSTQSPTQLVLTAGNADNSRQGFAIGFATTRITLKKNIGERLDASDQFVLDIAGTPSSSNTTTGSAVGLQPQFTSIYAIPGSAYTLTESMAGGSASTLSQYSQILASMNSTPGGTVPPAKSLPVNFAPELGDDVTYYILNSVSPTSTKLVDKAYAKTGDILTYSVIITNPNNTPVSNVLMTDKTPAGTRYIGNLQVSAPYTGTDPESGITITSVAGDSSVTISWQVQVNTAPPVLDTISNTADILFPGLLPITTNTVTTRIRYAAVNAVKSVNKSFAAAGEVVTYTLLLSNTGNTDANNIVLTDELPSGISFVAGSLVGAAGTPPTLTLNRPIAPGGSATVSFQAAISSSAPVTNPVLNSANVAFTYTADPLQPDGAAGSSSSNIVSTTVNTAVITTTKSVDKSFASTGEILTYTIVLNNTGNTSANKVTITDVLPVGASFVPGSVMGASGTPPTLTLANPIEAGGNAVVSFQVKIGSSVPSNNPLLNTANVAFTYTQNPAKPDGASGTSQGNTVSTVVNSSRMTVTKSTDKATAYIGSEITYHLVITNTGNSPTDNVVLTDLIPNGTEYVDESLTVSVPFTGLPAAGIHFINPVLPGETIIVSFQIKVIQLPKPNPIINTAKLSYTYTINPNDPDGETSTITSNGVCTKVFRYNFSQQITDLIQSVALEEAALANIANIEGAKIQAMVAMKNITTEELLCVNKSVSDMLDSISLLEGILKQKLSAVSCQIDTGCSGC